MTSHTVRAGRRRGRELHPRMIGRVRQMLADRRRGGRLPRNLRRIAACALIIAAGLLAVTPPKVATGDPVVIVTRDLPVGAVLQDADLALVPRTDAPDGALDDPGRAAGRTLAGATRRGEVVTDVRLVDPIGPAPGPGRVAVPIRPADSTVTDLLRPGMHVAVVSVADDGNATVLVPDAVVLLIGAAGERGDADPPVVLAVPQDAADRVVAAALTGTVALRFI